MRLSDVFGHLDLTTYPKIGMIIFMTIFVAVVYRVLRASKQEMSHCSRMAMDDGLVGEGRVAPAAARQEHTSHSAGQPGRRSQGAGHE